MNKLFFIKKNYEFQEIIKNNKPYFFNDFILVVKKNNLNFTRFGISVGKKKYKLAVTRNKIKRQTRHILQMFIKDNIDFNSLSLDIIIIVRIKNYPNVKFSYIKDSLYTSLIKIKNAFKNRNNLK